jgi:hypothetical protein
MARREKLVRFFFYFVCSIVNIIFIESTTRKRTWTKDRGCSGYSYSSGRR